VYTRLVRSILAFVLLAGCAAPLPPPPPAAVPCEPPPSAAPPAAEAHVPCQGERFGLPQGADGIAQANIAGRRGTMGAATTRMVATSNAVATEAGLAVLRAGGDAADAFVAAALVDDLVLPGVTSTAGLAGILVYEARTRTVTYVHGGLADPQDPARRFRRGDVESGRLVLVPGAPAAYAEVIRRFGHKSLAEAVEPAASLASKGFPIDALYAGSIADSRAKLEASAFGRAAFFRAGRVLREGETLKLEETAKTLRSFGKDPRWFYRGPWVEAAVRTANEHGGTLAARDFVAYAPEVGPAIHGRYLGYDLYAGGLGGATLLASLGALETLRGGEPARPLTTSAGELELLLRITAQARDARSALGKRGLVTAGGTADALVADVAQALVGRVRAGMTAQPSGPEGSHSAAVVVVDADGNVVVGTHTIEALNWGEGLFVGGVPLSTAAAIGVDDPGAATLAQRADPLSDTIVLQNGEPRAALAVYGSGLFPGDMQVLDALLARGLDAEQAVLEPRVGHVEWDPRRMTVDVTKRVVDPRFEAELLCQLQARGFTLERSMPGARPGFVDTGFPTLVTMAPGHLHGMTPDAPFVHGLAAGD
jgi:gamma-glutamyltranspeptidase / glutathione hydrolase